MALLDGVNAQSPQAQSSVRLVVVDVETTGVYNNDRIVEVAVVTTSPDGTILDEWETLVNPGRDVGPTHLHGIVASMVSGGRVWLDSQSEILGRCSSGRCLCLL